MEDARFPAPAARSTAGMVLKTLEISTSATKQLRICAKMHRRCAPCCLTRGCGWYR